MTLTELLPLVDELPLAEKEQLRDRLDGDILAERRDADQAWLGEIDRRIQGYYDGSIPTLSREEVNALIAADRANAS